MASKSISVSNDVEFGALVNALARDVVDAHIYWGQHTALQAQLERFPDVYAEGSTFWIYTLEAHQRTALASLARAFDQEPNSLHLRSWLTSIRDHLHLFGKDAVLKRRPGDPFAKWLSETAAVPDPGQLKQDIELCSPSNSDVAALIRYRHNVLAHRGAKLSKLGDVTKLPGLSYDQIERLMERAQTILNRYNYMFDASYFGMTPLGHDHVERVFDCVQRDLDRHKADVDAQFARVGEKQREFEAKVQAINSAAKGREAEAAAERKTLATQYGYAIDDMGNIKGVILWTKAGEEKDG